MTVRSAALCVVLALSNSAFLAGCQPGTRAPDQHPAPVNSAGGAAAPSTTPEGKGTPPKTSGPPPLDIYLVVAVENLKVTLTAENGSSYPQGDSRAARTEQALRDLFAYPAAPDEGWWGASKRLGTMVPDGTKLLGLAWEQDRVVVNVSREALNVRGPARYLDSLEGKFGLTLLAQIVVTATQLAPDKGVVVLVDGKQGTYIGEKNADISHPWHRKDLAGAFVVEDGGGRRIPLK